MYRATEGKTIDSDGDRGRATAVAIDSGSLSTESARRSRRTARLAASAFFIGAVLYGSWVITIFFDFGSPQTSDYVSELIATDQPLSGLLRAADFATAAVIGFGVIVSMAGGRVHGRMAAVAWAALALFAVATALDSAWAMSCAPHADPVCAAREAAGAVPLSHQLHTVSSVLAVAAALTSLIAFLCVDARERVTSRVHRLGLWLLGGLAATTVSTCVGVVLDSTDRGSALGVAQRLQLLCVSGWLVYVALREARRT
ncbi:DUF998 domain-containing protein [Mycolicibacterium pallens]|uniref:DUF998 domain-containing protein n=1 Tax=Mycolicibacterium pallens TaxID=370524 RepID=A0ABX8VHX4_9MYCO|nr:DUF998 domain-containing protein [Mycolicibacterium pallens]QYL17415.1 DUF998 domain-containing protein [Mycolicibacterium pallens]